MSVAWPLVIALSDRNEAVHATRGEEKNQIEQWGRVSTSVHCLHWILLVPQAHFSGREKKIRKRCIGKRKKIKNKYYWSCILHSPINSLTIWMRISLIFILIFRYYKFGYDIRHLGSQWKKILLEIYHLPSLKLFHPARTFPPQKITFYACKRGENQCSVLFTRYTVLLLQIACPGKANNQTSGPRAKHKSRFITM